MAIASGYGMLSLTEQAEKSSVTPGILLDKSITNGDDQRSNIIVVVSSDETVRRAQDEVR